jgi:hypothetical protein
MEYGKTDWVKEECEIIYKSPVKKLIRALKSLNVEIEKNSSGIDKLKDLETLFPNIQNILEEEKLVGLELMELYAIRKIIDQNITPNIVRLGGYWMDLFNSPDFLYLPSGKLIVECYTDDYRERSIGGGDDEGGYLISTDRIMVYADSENHQKWRELARKHNSIIK